MYMNSEDFGWFIKTDYAKMQESVDKLNTNLTTLISAIQANQSVDLTDKLDEIKNLLKKYIDLHEYFPEYLKNNCSFK